MFDAKGGEGASMLDLGGACEMDTFFCVWYVMHSCLFLCIVIYVIFAGLWDLCDMCSLYFVIYMICHLVMLICFAFVFYSVSNELYFVYSCLFYIFWVHYVGLVRLSIPNPFDLNVICLYEPSMFKTSLISFTHTRGSVVINHQKGGDWKHLGP
jgi:hypothetical protein